MFYHHTKNKGDLGVLKAKLDLFEKGYLILVPETEHAPFDVVAFKDGKFLRIQVKYREAKEGFIYLSFNSSWADKNGSHTKGPNKEEIDLFCLYCPDTDTCYYIDPGSFKGSVQLRISPSKNNQKSGVNIAENFIDIPQRFL